jgi:hypothetical protein
MYSELVVKVVTSGYLVIEGRGTDNPQIHAFENFDHLVQFLRNRVADILLEREEGEPR